MSQASTFFLSRSRRVAAALVAVSMAATFVTPMARAQAYAVPVQPAAVYYQQAPQVVYPSAPQVVYQQPVYPPVVVAAPYEPPVWPAVAVGLGVGALLGGWWGHGYGGGGRGHEYGGGRGYGYGGGHGYEGGGHGGGHR